MRDADSIDIQLGASVRSRREALRITQAELAKAIGVTFQQVQKYEKGTNRISASRLVRIAALLETTCATLLGETGAEEIPGASALARQWCRIADPQERQAIVTLVRGLAG